VYDNACALHAFCLRRLPEFFRNTVFKVDKLHYSNHCNCSSAYSFSAWATDKQSAFALNTNVCEHFNRPLKSIRTQLSYMGGRNALAFLEMFVRGPMAERIMHLSSKASAEGGRGAASA